MGGHCVGIDKFPHVTIAEFGNTRQDVHEIKSEIYRRGPVAAALNAEPLVAYKGGIINDESLSTELNHAISIIGWGFDEPT